MRCNYVQKHIVVFIENQLPAQTTEKIKQHLSWCGHCSEVYKQVEEVLLPVKETMSQSAEMPETIVSGVMERIQDMPQLPAKNGNKYLAVIVIGATIILAIAISKLLQWI